MRVIGIRNTVRCNLEFLSPSRKPLPLYILHKGHPVRRPPVLEKKGAVGTACLGRVVDVEEGFYDRRQRLLSHASGDNDLIIFPSAEGE